MATAAAKDDRIRAVERARVAARRRRARTQRAAAAAKANYLLSVRAR